MKLPPKVRVELELKVADLPVPDSKSNWPMVMEPPVPESVLTVALPAPELKVILARAAILKVMLLFTDSKETSPLPLLKVIPPEALLAMRPETPDPVVRNWQGPVNA